MVRHMQSLFCIFLFPSPQLEANAMLCYIDPAIVLRSPTPGEIYLTNYTIQLVDLFVYFPQATLSSTSVVYLRESNDQMKIDPCGNHKQFVRLYCETYGDFSNDRNEFSPSQTVFQREKGLINHYDVYACMCDNPFSYSLLITFRPVGPIYAMRKIRTIKKRKT